MSNPVPTSSGCTPTSMEVSPAQEDTDTDYEVEDEESDGGADLPDDYEYWREEGEGD